MTKLRFPVPALLLGLLLASCSPQPAPAAAPAAPAPAVAPRAAPAPVAVPAVPVRPAWEKEWEKTLDGAEAEGRVVIATGLSGTAATTIMKGFRKAYGIPAEGISARGAEIALKALTERRAGLYNYDVFIVASTTALNNLKPGGAFDPMDPALILPDVTDPELIKKIWWQEKLWYVDSQHTNLAPMLTQILPVAINTTLVKEGEIKSYRDLLDPKWQGKTLLIDPTVVGTGPAWLAFVEATLGWDYAVEFAKTKPMVLRDLRQMMDWLAHGKASVVVGPHPDMLVEFIRAGAPVKGLIPSEGTWVLSGSASLSAMNKPPHPNAAKVFINWYLSKEGQTVVGPVAGRQSNRLDVPTNHLPPEQVRQAGVKYYIEEDEKLQLSQPDRMKRAEPLYGPLLAK